jgi:hypothetical protein
VFYSPAAANAFNVAGATDIRGSKALSGREGEDGRQMAMFPQERYACVAGRQIEQRVGPDHLRCPPQLALGFIDDIDPREDFLSCGEFGGYNFARRAVPRDGMYRGDEARRYCPTETD